MPASSPIESSCTRGATKLQAPIASGLDPVRVSKWLGHSQVSTTTDVYAKAFAARERHDAALVDAFHAQPAEEAESVGQSAGQ
jgi:hypothetical protein